MNKNTRIKTGWQIKGFWVVCLMLFLSSAAQAEPVCAEVKIEIAQELTLERQAFDANMKISNDLDNIPLLDVNIDIHFTDREGDSVVATSDPNAEGAKFFIRIDTMTGIDSIAGGTVEPGTKADIHWLIIPAPGTSEGNINGTLYFVGATLSYTVGGELETVEITPDFIRVKPLPLLSFDYFLTQYVEADNPLTPEIEPIEWGTHSEQRNWYSEQSKN